MENVLLINDDTDFFILLKGSLRKYGSTVTTLSNPAVVQKTIDEQLPDIVILDINIGEWDGREICKQLKNLPPYETIPIILYSDLADAYTTLETYKADLFLQNR